MLRQLFIAFLSAMLLVYTSTAGADDRDMLFSMSIESLMQIKVSTASKRTQDVDVAPSIVAVFTRQDIDKMGVNSLIDVLKHAPGIETSMAPTGLWRVSIRGARKEGIILLLIDGHPFNDFYDGQAQFDLPVAFINKVEIIRGPGSALYGTNAVAGVINVFTHNNQRTAELGIGNDNSHRIATSFYRDFSIGKWSMNVLLNSTDGQNVVEGEDFVEASNSTTTETNRFVDELLIASKFQADDYLFSFLLLDKERGPWVGPTIEFGPMTRVGKLQYFANASREIKIGKDLKLTPWAHFGSTDFDSLNQDIGIGRVVLSNPFPNGGFTRETYKTSNFGAELQIEYSLNQDLLFLAGLSHETIKMDDYDLKRDYEVIGFIPHEDFANHDQLVFEQADKDRKVSAIYAQSEFQWTNLGMTLGFRYDDYSDFGSSYNPRLGLVYKFSPNWNSKILYGSAFRAPTFRELYDNTRIGTEGFIGNNQLQPEESQTLEFLVEYQYIDYGLKINFFDVAAEDVIGLYDPGGSGERGNIENLGNIDTKGFETEAIYQMNAKTRWFANFSRYKAEFEWREAPLFADSQLYLQQEGDKRLFNQPRTRANIGVDWSSEDWKLFLSVNYGGRASHNNTLPLEGLRNLIVDEYIQYNFSVSYQWAQDMTLRLSGSGLGDNKNSDPNGSSESDTLGIEGLLQPAESIMFDLSYQF